MDNMDYDGMGNQGRFMNDDDIKYRQGKSKRQVEDSELNALIGCIGLGLVILGIIIWGIIDG